MQLHIGIDDTDSLNGGCTTYIAARLVERILNIGGQFLDYPILLRLNPNVPWKTRGNGAVCLHFDINPSYQKVIQENVLNEVELLSDFSCENTNPGVVIHEGEIPKEFSEFSSRVIRSVVSLKEAFELIDRERTFAVGYKNKRGLIGALAAVGGLTDGDFTYEFLAYRHSYNCGTRRRVDLDSVRHMDEVMSDVTFNNVDTETGRILIMPNGLDPVLFGIRGEEAQPIREAGLMISSEPTERWVIFRTNQGTDSHLTTMTNIMKLRPYNPVIIDSRVSRKPRTIRGGHVIFEIEDDTGSIDCAAYEPTGGFRGIMRELIPGDLITAYGGIRVDNEEKRLTLNLEKLKVIDLTEAHKLRNPSCPKCEGSTESMGKGKGLRCKKCGFKDPKMTKIQVNLKRKLSTGLYIPPPRAMRHLAKPLKRYGKEKHGPVKLKMINDWCSNI